MAAGECIDLDALHAMVGDETLCLTMVHRQGLTFFYKGAGVNLQHGAGYIPTSCPNYKSPDRRRSRAAGADHWHVCARTSATLEVMEGTLHAFGDPSCPEVFKGKRE
jgi:hypothetical protein